MKHFEPVHVMTSCDSVEKFPVVMLYDHFSSVRAAMNTYRQLATELQHDFKTELRIWSLEEATSAENWDAADKDFASAEVIIVSMRHDEPGQRALPLSRPGANPLADHPSHAIVSFIDGQDGASGATPWMDVVGADAVQISPELFVCDEAGAATAGALAGAAP